jgi:hypothetical protein
MYAHLPIRVVVHETRLVPAAKLHPREPYAVWTATILPGSCISRWCRVQVKSYFAESRDLKECTDWSRDPLVAQEG